MLFRIMLCLTLSLFSLCALFSEESDQEGIDIIHSFSQLLPDGNTHSIAKAFEKLDPTTSEIIPILSVLNSSSEERLEYQFSQFDPSSFNAVLFAEEEVAQQVQNLLTDNFWLYKRYNICNCEPYCVRFWAMPFENNMFQRGTMGSIGHSGYRHYIHGSIFGGELLLTNEYLLGVAYSSINSRVKWSSAPSSAHFKTYEWSVYGAIIQKPLWVDVSFSFSRNAVRATRTIEIDSPTPFIDPIFEIINHKNKSDVWAAHVAVAYDLWKTCFCESQVVLWPFITLESYSAHQPSYNEHGGGILDLHVNRKKTQMLRPEIGIGCSIDKQFCRCATFLNTSLSFAREWRFRGHNTKAHFKNNPESCFSVKGLLPGNNIFCPTMQIGFSTPSDNCRLFLNYNGAFGSKMTSNELSAELALAF